MFSRTSSRILKIRMQKFSFAFSKKNCLALLLVVVIIIAVVKVNFYVLPKMKKFCVSFDFVNITWALFLSA
jgi:hypothetical protein